MLTAPSGEKELSGHVVQVNEPSILYVPASHSSEHSSNLPISPENVPALHGVHEAVPLMVL